MKKIISLIFVIFLTLLINNFVSAANSDSPCALSVTLLNQDPYPAVTGDYVDVLFQVSGVNDNCQNGAAIDLVLDYPFTIDSGLSYRTIKSSTYAGDGSNSNWNSLYKLRIDENAIEKNYEVELRYKEGSDLNWDEFFFKKFNITINSIKTDFEVHVQNYKIVDKNIVFEILNTGDQDIKALTVEIPKQDNIVVKGSNRNIVGDLDANEYTTADFEAMPKEGNLILYLYYTDSINERRMVEKTVYYDSNYFIGSKDNTVPSKVGSYAITVIVLLLIVFFFVRRHRHKKRMKNKKEFEL